MSAKHIIKKSDFILIAVVLAVVAVLVFVLYGVNNHTGEFVQIEIDGSVVKTMSLQADDEYEIASSNGGANKLVISDGYAKMTDANCPDGICKNHKRINRVGESIICLPNKVVVTIVSNLPDADDIDAVA